VINLTGKLKEEQDENQGSDDEFRLSLDLQAKK
jgi:hypothetical protein